MGTEIDMAVNSRGLLFQLRATGQHQIAQRQQCIFTFKQELSGIGQLREISDAMIDDHACGGTERPDKIDAGISGKVGPDQGIAKAQISRGTFQAR